MREATGAAAGNTVPLTIRPSRKWPEPKVIEDHAVLIVPNVPNPMKLFQNSFSSLVSKILARLTSDSNCCYIGWHCSTNPYLGVPCISNPKIQFPNDITEVDKIKNVEPTIITPGNPRHRAWLNISGKVPVYAPVDSELVNGVYKNARGALDYDLHFQVSCEIWYLINHLTNPVDKIKNAFPKTPQTDTRTSPPFKEPIQVKAGELLGYTTGTPTAHNFDFGVFDLNNFNKGLPIDEGLKYGKEANFICPFDVLPEDLKKDYYSKIIPSEKSFTNCKAY